jgi:calcineurin-like phosphoesterase family protein
LRRCACYTRFVSPNQLPRMYFTSDHHFGHANIIKYCKRPFSSVGEMDAALVQRWNDTVGADDVVYHLGDFMLQDLTKFATIVRQLNGQLKILPGSHDRRWLASFRADDPGLRTRSGHTVELLPPLLSLEIPALGHGRRPQVIVLCHYALRVWDQSHHGAWHLYGHSHGNLPSQGLSFDVGVDCNAFLPLELEEVAGKMSALQATLTSRSANP